MRVNFRCMMHVDFRMSQISKALFPQRKLPAFCILRRKVCMPDPLPKFEVQGYPTIKLFFPEAGCLQAKPGAPKGMGP